METNSDLMHELASEKSMRMRLEEECGKLQGLVILLENQLKAKSQEIHGLKTEHSLSLCDLSQQVGQYKNKSEVCLQENESLRKSLTNLKADYFSLTDTDIQKASKIDELYIVLTQYQEEVKNLSIELSKTQLDLQESRAETRVLLERLQVQKQHKFVQADPSPLCTSIGISKSPKNMYTIPSLAKTKSQIHCLQKAKSRLDLQIHLLSKFD